MIAFPNGTRHLQKTRNYIIGCGDELDPTPVFEDNTAVIRYGRDIGLARASRILAQRSHFGRDQQQLGLIDVRGVPSANNLVDFFTSQWARSFSSTSNGLACGPWRPARYSACDPLRPARWQVAWP